jgi:hypothetical protein
VSNGTFDIAIPGLGIVTYNMTVNGTYNMTSATVSSNGTRATLTYSIKINNVLRNVPVVGTAQSGSSYTTFYAYGYTYRKS